MSEVALARVKHEKDGVYKAVQRALGLINYQRYLEGSSLFIKTNLIWNQLVPGACISPFFHDAILREVTKLFGGKIYVGDADLASEKQCKEAARVWGLIDLCKEYGVEFVNLSDDQQETIDLHGKVLGKVEASKKLLEADSIIQLAPLKTHCLSTITCALKGHWGLISRSRHNWHLVLDEAISDIVSYFKNKVIITCVDGTIAMEGQGPKTGRPKITDLLLAGRDPVAIDTVASKVMGFDPYKIGHIIEAERRGLGQMRYKLVGDPFPTFNFELPNYKNHPVFNFELFFRRIPVLRSILFKTPIFSIPAKIAVWYNVNVFYFGNHFFGGQGKKWLEEILLQPFYGEEFKPLVELK